MNLIYAGSASGGMNEVVESDFAAKSRHAWMSSSLSDVYSWLISELEAPCAKRLRTNSTDKQVPRDLRQIDAAIRQLCSGFNQVGDAAIGSFLCGRRFFD